MALAFNGGHDGGGGGSMPLQVVTAKLTDDEIKQLPVTAGAITLVAPTEVLGYTGFMPNIPYPLTWSVILDSSAGSYTGGPANGKLTLGIGNFGAGSVPDAYVIEFLPENFVDLPATLDARQYVPPTVAGGAYVSLGGFAGEGDLNDNGLYLNLPNLGGTVPLGGGDPANFMVVTVAYIVIPLTP